MQRRTIGVALVFAAAAILLVVKAGSVPLFDPDEARFARTSVEMLRSQDLVVPHFEGQPRLVKPPLMHWIQSSFFGAFGVSERVARLHSILATLGSLWLLAAVASRRFGAEAAVWALAVMGTMPLVVAMGRIGTLDALLAVHILAAWALDLAAPADPPSPYRAPALGAILGLAFLIKGPVGVVLPLLMILTGRTLAGRDVLPSLMAAFQALLAGCLVVAPWALAFVRRVEWDTALGTLRQEALERFYASPVHNNPPWFYVPVLILGLMPWIGPLVVGLVRIVPRRRDPGARTALYAAAGLLSGFVFFSLAKSRLPSYVLPLAPPAALVVIWQLGQELEDPRRRRAGSAMLAVTLGLFAVVLVIAGFRLDQAAYARGAWVGAVIYGVGFVCAALGAWKARPRWVYGCAAATSFAFLLSVALTVLPGLGQTKSAKELIAAVPELREGRLVIVVDMKLPSLTFYLDSIPESVDMPNLADRISVAPRGLLVFDRDDIPATPASVLERLIPVGEQGKYLVFELSPTRLVAPPPIPG